MMGVGGAASSLTTFAKQVARPALQKQIAQQTLTKTAWYGPMKQTLKLIGIKISKDSFAKGVTRTVPVIGGVHFRWHDARGAQDPVDPPPEAPA